MKNPQDGEAHENLFQHLEVDGFARIACLNCSRAETKKQRKNKIVLSIDESDNWTTVTFC